MHDGCRIFLEERVEGRCAYAFTDVKTEGLYDLLCMGVYVL